MCRSSAFADRSIINADTINKIATVTAQAVTWP